jgi:hypothetical protein
LSVFISDMMDGKYLGNSRANISGHAVLFSSSADVFMTLQ